ncbi:DUF4232 domain-containing protein [Micromonospora sp. NBS 11-29]|uniref:DUF4232 domain-containing protein n=1 Tax=Micromonospora sp. NBS 11-29 TaxID=1960879 RepID=UPI000B76F961|nr:DUF4232 domain-containing protein [Micromonospora sp. NBS 11-29]
MRNAAAPAVLLAALTLTTACAPMPDPATSPEHAPAASPTPACTPEGIRITGLGVSAAMGLRAMGLDLVNCGNQPYELRGYPAVALRDADGQPIVVRIIPGAKPITSGFDDPPTRLVLRPGEHAGAALIWRNLFTDPTATPTEGTRLDAAPVAGRPAYPVELDGPIDLGNTGRLGVSAWKRRDPDPTTEPATPSGPPSSVVVPDNPL